MTSPETAPADTAPQSRPQRWLLVLAIALFVAASIWTFRSLDAWKEIVSEWRVNPRDVAELDERVTGRRTGQIAGLNPGQVTRHRQPAPLAPGAITSEWTRLLGPNNDCTSPETPLAKSWPEEGPPLVWEKNIGPTYATPAIQGNHLIHFYRYGSEEVVACVNSETGEKLWEVRSPTTYEDQYGYGGGPKCAPVIDGDYVYTYGVQGLLQCLQLDTGDLVWKNNPVEEYQLSQNFFGVGDAPLIEGDLLLVTVGSPNGPCVAAYKKHTGEMVWGTGDEWRAGYASPIAAEIHGQRRVFVFAGGDTSPPKGGLMVIDPVEGKEVFRFPWRGRAYESANASCPVVVGNEVFISASYRRGGVMLRLDPDGSYEERWRTSDLKTHWMTPVYKDGYLYGFDGRYEKNATLVCLEWATGKLMWREQITWTERYLRGGRMLEEQLSPGRASLLSADGHFLCLGERGHLLWLDLNPEGYQVISRTWLVRSDEIWGLPVVSHGLLYVTQSKLGMHFEFPRLLCYDLRAPAPE